MHISAKAQCLLSAASLSMMGVIGASIPSAAVAEVARNAEINVPAMPMADAIGRISAQTGVAIGADPDAIKGLTSNPVSGARSAREAVRQATRGTSVAIVSAANGGLTLINEIVVTARRDEAETSVLVRQTTTSDRNGLGLRNQPRNTQVITAKTIEEQQALSITDVLRNAGGVSAQLNNPNSGASYTVRGFNASGLINGLSSGSAYGVNAGANQPIANIERVEILKGPDALIAGFDNLGGNVNVVTKKPSAEQRLAVTFDTGSYGLARGVVDANSAITADKKLSARVIGSAQTMDHNYGGYDGGHDYLIAPTARYKDLLTDIVIGASLSRSMQGLNAYTIFNRTTLQIVDRDPSVPLYTPDQGIRINTDRYYFDATRQIAPWIDFVARGMHDKTQLTVGVGSPGFNRAGLFGLDFTGSQQSGNSDALDTFVRIKANVGDLVKLRFNAGYNYSRGEYKQSSGVSTVTVRPLSVTAPPVTDTAPLPALGSPLFGSNGKQEGVYGQAMAEIGKFKILGGLRKNWFETTAQFFFAGAPTPTVNRKHGVIPNAGVIFDATDWLSLFANYSRGEQAIFTVGRGGVILPNIKTRNKEAGAKIDLFNKRATINASYFDIQQDNTVVRSPIDQQLDPGPGQRGRGIDLNVTGQLLPGWTVLGSLTRTNYKLLTITQFQNQVARQPRDTYSLYSAYRTRLTDNLSGGMSAGLYGRSSSYADPLVNYVVPPARQVDVNGFLSFAGFDVNLGVRNIFDRRNYSPATGPAFIPVDEPRNVRLTITKRLF